MYKIMFTNESVKNIDGFIDSYFNSFINLFVDSGINNFDLIEKNYLDLSFKYRNNIYDKLNNFFCEELIGKTVGDDRLISTVLLIGNFRLFIYFFEDINKKIRYIEKIKFYKK